MLDVAWRVPYEAGTGKTSALRLGPGSGSTPSLMGTAPGDDKFVVITDGQELMHLVLLYQAPRQLHFVHLMKPIPFQHPALLCSL